jgi:hypothetical protein
MMMMMISNFVNTFISVNGPQLKNNTSCGKRYVSLHICQKHVQI